jgi:hypothetical protein
MWKEINLKLKGKELKCLKNITKKKIMNPGTTILEKQKVTEERNLGTGYVFV